MKQVKRILSILLAVMVAAMLSVPAFAEGDQSNEEKKEDAATPASITLTVQGGAADSEYAAYKLLNLNYSTSTSDGGGSVTEKYAYLVWDKYRAILQEATGETLDGDIVLAFENSDAATLRTLADTVYKNILNLSSTKNKVDPEYTATADENGNAVFEGVDQGYYLIVETHAGTDSDSYSLAMLATAGQKSVTVTTKEGVPTLTKKVKADNSTDQLSGVEWTDAYDAADYDIGDDVPFQLTGTIPQNIANYTKYQYVFHDTLAAGFTYNEDVKFYAVSTENGKTTWTEMTTYTSSTDGKEYPVYSVTTKVNEDGTTELTFTCNVVNGIVKNAKEGDLTVIRYTAKLTDKAVIGSAGNTNEAYLEYSNNPYDTSSTGKSATDKVKVFTYQAIVNKVGDDGKTALAGAGFTLYKKNSSGEFITVKEITPTEDDTPTTFTFTGLDAGTYKLVENTVPTGFHAADDLIFKIDATYDTVSDDPQLTALAALDSSGTNITGEDKTFVANLTAGSLTTTVINETGTLLPSTGGIGTKIFTIGGIALMVAAGVLLVTRRRMAE